MRPPLTGTPPHGLLRPGWVVVALALLAVVVGGTLAARAWMLQPQRQAELAGLRLRLERAVWLHEPMDHGDAAPLPLSEGAPAPGERRLTAVLIAFNPGGIPTHFSAQELALSEGDSGPAWHPKGAAATRDFRLAPGQSVPVSVDFDVPATAGPLRLEWRRGAARVTMLATRPPPRAALDALPRWPRRVEELPPGNPSSGAELFHGRFACVSCHGDPSRSGSQRLGPSLYAFARVGATRLEGRSAAQYAYESLLDPSAFIAPGCAGQDVCAQPSTMPMYGDSLSPQQMADLLSYLLQVRE